MSLPHRFPFRLVDRSGDAVRVAITADAYWLRGAESFGLPFLIEAAAQAAALLAAPAGEALDDLRLAGVSACELKRPICAGEILDLELALEARRGAIARVGATVSSAGEEVARLTLTLSGPSGLGAVR